MIGCVYNPPNCIISDSFKVLLEKVALNYDHILILGDFNIDLLKKTTDSQMITDLFNIYGFYTPSNEPTHFERNSSTLIDHLYCLKKDNLLIFNQIDISGISKHDMIFCSYDLPAVETTSNVTYYYDYKNFDLKQLTDLINNIPWEIFYNLLDPCDQVEFFNYHISKVHNDVFPLKKSKNKTINYVSDPRLFRLKLERNRAFRLWKSDRTNDNYNHYKSLRNKVNTFARDIRRKNLATSFFNITQAEFWKKINNLGFGSKEKQVINYSAEEINNYFISNFTSSNNTTLPSLNMYDNDVFSIRTTNVLEIDRAINSIKSNAAGLDGMNLKFLKIIQPFILHALEYMYNNIITKCIFPYQWKKSKIIPLPKKSSVDNLKDLRPISLLPILSKVFEILLREQIVCHVEQKKLLNSNQSGFRKGHSTQTALLKISDDIAKCLDNREVSYLALLDFSKAFDTINHSRLLEKLSSNFFFDLFAIKLIKSYLEDRYQCVSLNGIYSDMKIVGSGVPQGSILSPILFAMYINDLTEVIEHSTHHMYADDVQLYISGKANDSESLENMLISDLKSVSDWAENNSLALNTTKTILLPIYRLRGSFFSPQLTLNDQILTISTSARNLGLIFDNRLDWKCHITSICSKIYATLRTLRQIATDLPSTAKLKLVKTLILPLLTYCDTVYSSATNESLDSIRLAINACIRFIYSLTYRDHVSPFYLSFLGSSFDDFFKHRYAILMHRIYNLNMFIEKFCRSSSNRTLNFNVPRAKTTHYNRSIVVRGPVLWNKLPTEIKCLRSEDQFRQRCQEFINNTDNF